LSKYYGKLKFTTSGDYWENRYKIGGNSGAGSYNNLAEFKAEIVNNFVIENNIKSVIDFGCGDGNQLSYLNLPKYLGVDVSQTAIKICKKKYKNDTSKAFLLYEDAKNHLQDSENRYDLGLSMDVLYHLNEEEVFSDYLSNLFAASKKYVIIYSINIDNPLFPIAHIRPRKFTDWIDSHIVGWSLYKYIKNKYPYDEKNPNNNTSWSDFYIYKKLL